MSALLFHSDIERIAIIIIIMNYGVHS